MTDALRDRPTWRLNAGDECTVMDELNQRLVSIPCGGLTGRTRSEAESIARLIASAPKLLAQLEWAEMVLKCWIEGSAQLEAIRADIARATGATS